MPKQLTESHQREKEKIAKKSRYSNESDGFKANTSKQPSAMQDETMEDADFYTEEPEDAAVEAEQPPEE